MSETHFNYIEKERRQEATESRRDDGRKNRNEHGNLVGMMSAFSWI